MAERSNSRRPVAAFGCGEPAGARKKPCQGMLVLDDVRRALQVVYDGSRFAAVALEWVTHGELAEQELGRPGAGDDQIERGHLNLVADVVTYEIYHSPGREPDVEAAIRRWVEELTGRPAAAVDVAPPAWEYD